VSGVIDRERDVAPRAGEKTVARILRGGDERPRNRVAKFGEPGSGDGVEEGQLGIKVPLHRRMRHPDAARELLEGQRLGASFGDEREGPLDKRAPQIAVVICFAPRRHAISRSLSRFDTRVAVF
jgi:hypothetical protein